MGTVPTDRIDEAYSKFCKHMSFNDTSWRSIFEFSYFIGFCVLNVTRSDVRHGGDLEMPDDAHRSIEILHGSNAEMLLRAYKVRRYSFRGRLRALWLMPTHVMGLVCAAIVAVFLEMWSGL